MKKAALSLVVLLCASFLHGASYRIPVMVLPFENKTDARQLDRFTSWLKAELKGYDNVRIIDFYKSTNVNGTLLLFMKPMQDLPFGKKNNVDVPQKLPDVYYIVTGTITYSDYRYNIHADVINSATEWVIAKDDIYISGLENVRSLLVGELGRRLSLKMNFRRVETYNEQKVLSQATNGAGTNTNASAAQTQVAPPPPPVSTMAEQQNYYNEKKQVMIVYNTNEKKVLEDLRNNRTNAQVKKAFGENVSLDGKKPEIKFYNSPFEHELSFQPLISGDFRENSNAIFTSYELAYHYQIIPALFIGLNLGTGFFDVKGKDADTNDYKYNIFEFRIMPNVMYRWYFIEPFFVDLEAGGGGFFGNATYAQKDKDALVNSINGFVVQARAGIGMEVKRLTFGLYFVFEWQRINYSDVYEPWTFDVLMTTIGLSLGFKF